MVEWVRRRWWRKWCDGEMVLFIGNGFESCLWQVEGEELECWVVRSERDDGGELRGFGCT